MDMDRIIAHYNVDDLTGRVLSALEQEKGSLREITIDDLVPIEGFHIRGRKSTVELAELLQIDPGDRVLDVGAGPGGTARYLSATFGCRSVGIDLTPNYVKLADTLSQLVGLGDRTAFACANALELPFADESFDIVWTEHVQMNIADKERFVSELTRILKPSGKIAFHDVFRGRQGDPYLPVPWSGDASTSFIVHADELKQVFTEKNLEVLHWKDLTEISNQWFQKQRERMKKSTPSPFGIHLLMGPNAKEKIANIGRSLADGRAQVIFGVLQKGG